MTRLSRSPGTQEQVAAFQMDRGRVTAFLKAFSVDFAGSGVSVFVDGAARIGPLNCVRSAPLQSGVPKKPSIVRSGKCCSTSDTTRIDAKGARRSRRFASHLHSAHRIARPRSTDAFDVEFDGERRGMFEGEHCFDLFSFHEGMF